MTTAIGKDRIDDKLVSLLRQDGRASISALAKAVNLSRTAVQARIDRLERDGVILGYQAILAQPSQEDEVGAILAVTFSQHPCTPVVAKFRHWPEIRHHYSVTGPIDGYFVVRAKGTSALNDLVLRLSAIEGVASVSSAVMLKAD